MEESIPQTILLLKSKQDNCLSRPKIPNSVRTHNAKANLISKILSSIAKNLENSFAKTVQQHLGYMRNGIARPWKDHYADLILLSPR